MFEGGDYGGGTLCSSLSLEEYDRESILPPPIANIDQAYMGRNAFDLSFLDMKHSEYPKFQLDTKDPQLSNIKPSQELDRVNLSNHEIGSKTWKDSCKSKHLEMSLLKEGDEGLITLDTANKSWEKYRNKKLSVSFKHCTFYNMGANTVDNWMIPIKFLLLLQTYDNVQELDLSECALHEQSVPLLSRFPRLIKLNLSASFSYLPKLAESSKQIDNIDKQLAIVFGSLNMLKCLNLSNFPGPCRCTDSLPSTLERLRLKHCRANYISGLLPPFPNLKELRLADAKTLTQMPSLEGMCRDCPNLNILDLRCQHDPTNICQTKRLLLTFNNLQALYLQFGCGCPFARDKERNDSILLSITDKRFKLRETLRILYFPECKANAKSLCRIKHLTNLRALDLHAAESSDKIMKDDVFSALVHLEAINIGGQGKFDKNSLSTLGNCPNLQWINLAGSTFSFEDIQCLLCKLKQYNQPLSLFIHQIGVDESHAQNLRNEFMPQFHKLAIDSKSLYNTWNQEHLYLS